MIIESDRHAYKGGGQAQMSPSTQTSGGKADGLAGGPAVEPPKLAGAATTHGLTNGNGVRLGAGRTNGGGFTNGSGRTNGGGFTNGSGRGGGATLTPKSGRTNGGRFQAQDALARRRRSRAAQRRRMQALAAGLVIALTGLTALGLADASNGPRIDGRFGEWEARTFAVVGGQNVGIVAAGLQQGRLTGEMYLEFAAPPFASREDVWVFFDLDGDGATGYWTGAMGAEAAVQFAGPLGHLVAATTFGFSGGDRFDLNSLISHGRVPSAIEGTRVEFQAPQAPRAFEIARADGASASSTGALTPGGLPTTFILSGAPLSLKIQNGIRIDGQFSDWTGISRVTDAEDSAMPARLDILEVAAVGDTTSAQFLVDVRGAALQGTLPLRPGPLASEGGGSPGPAPPPRRTAGTDEVTVYLDTDLDAATGAAFEGIGAERLLRVEGVSGVVVAVEYFEFRDGAWKLSESHAEAAAGGGSLEASVDAAGLMGARVRFSVTGFEGLSDTNEQPVEVAREAGALGHPLGSPSPSPDGGSSVLVNPIPELSDVAAVAATVGLLALTVGARRRRAPHEGDRCD